MAFDQVNISIGVKIEKILREGKGERRARAE
jgi:hypothetical protein